ncbi:MAG TPA: PIN domain-containing protein [Solirubrobacteraceae bacterium]
MTIVVDTDVVVALYDSGDAAHGRTADWVRRIDEDLVTTPLGVAEMDKAVTDRGGERGRAALLRDLDRGAFVTRWWADGLSETLAIARRHTDLDLTDASLVALCRRLRTNRIATFDPRFETFDLTLLPERT